MAYTSKLQAVNTMLSALGVAPIPSLTGNRTNESALAEDLLEETSTSVQLEGWNVNSEVERIFTPDPVTSEIILGPNTLFADGTVGKNDREQNLIQRGTKLYDRAANTYTFTEDVYLDVYTRLTWDELPEHLRQYIQIKSTRIYVDRMEGEHRIHIYTQKDEDHAAAIARRLDNSSRDITLKASLPAVARRQSALRHGLTH